MTDPRIDEYIADAEPFARPILKAVRAAVHAACPDVHETIKWSVPAYEYKGALCMTPAFKAHARVVFWNAPLLGQAGGDLAEVIAKAARLESKDDLPSKAALVQVLKAAVGLNEQGVKVRRPSRVPKPPVSVPPDLTRALKKVPKALAAFKHFPPSHQREYVEWIVGAQMPETRARRIDQAVEMMAVGKSLNSKYAR